VAAVTCHRIQRDETSRLGYLLIVRLLVTWCLIVGLTGCVRSGSLPPDPTPDDGWTGPMGDPVDPCFNACGGLTCARDGNCYPADQIHAVHASWTIDGGPANSATCTHPDLFIQFTDNDFLELGFAPVPCKGGRFTVDKLPLAYTTVFLAIEGEDTGSSAPIDPDTGDALLDL
jgi:hypothetical protein